MFILINIKKIITQYNKNRFKIKQKKFYVKIGLDKDFASMDIIADILIKCLS